VTAFLDANVLYPALLRNVMMYFAVARLYRPLWSDAVHAEWMTAVRRDHPDLTERQIARTRRLMTEHVPDATVTGYEKLVERLKLPDANDRHVLAAAGPVLSSRGTLNISQRRHSNRTAFRLSLLTYSCPL
jgi:hypothetical protein